jgi:hypothetical protein
MDLIFKEHPKGKPVKLLTPERDGPTHRAFGFLKKG